MTLAARIRRAVVLACTLGMVQVVLESLLVAVLYADYLLAPVTFFNVNAYDGYVKLYRMMAGLLSLPMPMDRFLVPGLGAKLAVAPQLAIVNLAIGAVVGLVAGMCTALALRRVDATVYVGRCLAVLVTILTMVHLWVWGIGLRIPADPDVRGVTYNFVRNFLFDGTVLALAVLAVAAGIVFWAARRGAVLRVWVAAVVFIGFTGVQLVSGASADGRHGFARHATRPAAVARDYNVVLVSIDSLRADHLGAYGYERETSPTMDRWALDGVLFRNASSTTAWTLPAHMSMLTGRSLLGHGVVSDDRSLTDDVPTLAEAFQGAGYTTGAVVSAPYLEKRYGYARGFDHYDDETVSFATHGDSYKHVTAPLLVETATKWLEANVGRQFFLFLHAWDVHYDYAPGEPYDSMFDPDYRGEIDGVDFYFNPAINRDMARRDLDHVLALYDGEIRLVDDHLAVLRSTFERLGVADRTIVIITSDHGDEFFEHGRKGHHRTLYDEILRVPFILYVPGAEARRDEVTMETSIIDIMPTILSLVGIDVPAGVEGYDLSGVAYGDGQEWDRPVLSELYRTQALNCQVSLRRPDEKVIHHFNRRIIEAYDLSEDPSESHPLPTSSGFPPTMLTEMTAQMNLLWTLYTDRLTSGGMNPLIMDAETKERLRSLGYID